MLIIHRSTRHNIPEEENFQQRRVENRKRHDHFVRSKSLLVHTPYQMSPFQIFLIYFFEIHFNIILPSSPRYTM